MKWSKLLQDPRWQKKRLQIMERDNFSCRNCHDSKKTLNVHHLYYERNLKPWEYPDESMVTFCYECHEMWHDLKLRLDKKSPFLIVELEWILKCIEHGPARYLEDAFEKNVKTTIPVTRWIKEEALKRDGEIDSQVVDCCLLIEEALKNV